MVTQKATCAGLVVIPGHKKKKKKTKKKNKKKKKKNVCAVALL